MGAAGEVAAGLVGDFTGAEAAAFLDGNLIQPCSLASMRSIRKKRPPMVRQVKMSRRPSRVRAMPTRIAQTSPARERRITMAQRATRERVERVRDMVVWSSVVRDSLFAKSKSGTGKSKFALAG